MNDTSLSNSYDIAVIGMSGRFPGASNLDEFWGNLKNSIESISFYSKPELLALNIDHEMAQDPYFIPAEGSLQHSDLFDADFFGYSTREAETMDPQQRLFLEYSWEALESAGYDPNRFKGAIGVYAGASINLYFLLQLYLNKELIRSIGIHQIRMLNRQDNLALRVSYKLQLQGPSITIQTNCSTSLVAIHLACQSLLNYESDMTLAGGISLGLPQTTGYIYNEGGFYSSNGHCCAFDANATGFVAGHGVGVVVLKRLGDAIAAGDCIHAIIKGSAVNNDGAAKVGYTAPSVDGQTAVIIEALAAANVDPETITYVETHGTGTPLGDPIEVKALTQAYRTRTDKKGFCAIGSVKTNIGHLDAAAGVASFLKTVLSLKNQQIPASLHFQHPNPQIDFVDSPFYVNTMLSRWNTNSTPRRAGINALGIGGTNAHVIVEEAPAIKPSETSRPYQLLLLSTKTSTALRRATTNLAIHLKHNPSLNLADVAYTLQVGRQPFQHRQVLVCQEHLEAIQALESEDPERLLVAYQESSVPLTVFMFPGGGTQYVMMGLELYTTEPLFRKLLDYCATLLMPHIDCDIRSFLFPNPDHVEQTRHALRQPQVGLPALFVVEYVLARMWWTWGIQPDAMIGHSLGEYVAACMAGVLQLEDALKLVAIRGQLMQQLPPGNLLVVPLAETALQPLLNSEIVMAAVNSPNLCVVSGTQQAIAELQHTLLLQDLECHVLAIEVGGHSPLIEPILDPFRTAVAEIPLATPQIPYISNVTGTWITDVEATDPEYWVQHLRQTVQFARGVETLLQSSDQILLLEVGPGRTLGTFVRNNPHKRSNHILLESLTHPKERSSDAQLIQKTLGHCWLTGLSIDWDAYYADESRQRIPLPTYPFERKRYWVEAQPDIITSDHIHGHLRKKTSIDDWFYVPSWQRDVLVCSTTCQSLNQPATCWLLFVDPYGFGAMLAQQLTKQGHTVIQVALGTEWSTGEEYWYTINPRCSDHYQTLLHHIYTNVGTLTHIVHFWNITTPSFPSLTTFDVAQDTGFYSLLWFVQALSRNHFTDVAITVLTNQMHLILGDELFVPDKAALLGVCKVISQEYPHIHCRTIDLAWYDVEQLPGQQVIEQLMHELMSPISDAVIAYRGNHRWIQTFHPLPVSLPTSQQTGLRIQGIYLITGGLGNIGMTIAHYLAETVQAKLVLLRRSAFPTREQWDHWIATHREDDVTSCKIRQIQAMEELGAQIIILQADVAAYDQMQQVLATTLECFGIPHGVIHAAGITGSRAICPITESSSSDSEEHFQVKVRGLRVLADLLQPYTPDFCMVCSSASTVLGGLGRSGYASANLVMDAYVQQYHRDGYTHWISINWDGWRFPQHSNQSNRGFGATLAHLPLSPVEGIEVFRRVIATHQIPQRIISTGDLQARIEQWVKLVPLQEPTNDRATNISNTVMRQRQTHQPPYIAPRTHTEHMIAGIWQDVFGIEQIGIHDNFFELGGHSLIAVQVASRMRQSLKVDVPMRSLFETPTVAAIAEHLEALQLIIQADQDKLPFVTDEVDEGTL